MLPGGNAHAQRAFANSDAVRPLRTEDALALERYALDAHVSPLSVHCATSDCLWSFNPELTYGIVPRTQVTVGLPMGFRSDSASSSWGLAAVNFSGLYSLNAERGSWPAFALRAGILIPAGRFGPRRAHESVKAIVTRTFRWGRVHFNQHYTFGNEPAGSDPQVLAGAGSSAELSRWSTGFSIDRTLPLQALLLAAEAVASQPLADSRPTRWEAGAGLRYQLTARTTIDAGLAKSVSGAPSSWTLRLGVGRTTAIRSLIPGLGPWEGR